MKTPDLPAINFKGPALVGLSLLALLCGGGVAWSYYAELSSAVVAQGAIGLQGKPKTIQHAEGGIVETIDVATGDQVEKGQLLLELDDTNVLANLQIYRGRLRDSLATRGRLLAELDDKTDVLPLLEDDAQTYELTSVDVAVEQQRTLMRARRQTRDGELTQYDEKIAQLQSQIGGTKGLQDQTKRQIEIYLEEQKSIASLVEKRIVARNQMLTFDRAVADLRGRIAEQTGEVARLQNSIAEAKVARGHVERQFRERAISELDGVETTINELRQQISATVLQLKRMSIRAPVSGTIHELTVHTIGGVIQPGQAILQIIAANDTLEVEVNVDTQSIDSLSPGQLAYVRFPAFHSRTTPEISGTVTQISPSSVVEERTGAAFYRVKISVSPEELAKLEGKPLIPGMPVEAVVPTGKRTVMSYLLKPLTDQLNQAMREE